MTKQPHSPAGSDQTIPWRESGHFNDPVKLPGQVLSGARYREGLTQAELARLTGLTSRYISGMENGHKPIDAANARKLAAALNIDCQRLLTP
jgi:plasmid maintenance system antidote protein VapI